jgi:nucleotide-binding universal stress UspA family protein
MVAAAKSRGLIFRREVRVGVDFREILDYAVKHEIDLIVMATHGRTGLAHALLGSVAEKVVRKSRCPVLTIKHPAMKFEMP